MTTYTATVRPSYLGAVVPTQSVAFLDNGQPVSARAGRPIGWTGAVATATCSVSYTRPGQHLITARYSGDASFASSTSSPSELVDAVAGRIHPVLSWSFYYAPRYTNVLTLMVDRVPPGARVRVSCAGTGCPLTARAVSLHRSSPVGGEANLAQLFASHRLRPGTVIEVTISRPGWIGKRYSFKVRVAHPPRLDHLPGAGPGRRPRLLTRTRQPFPSGRARPVPRTPRASAAQKRTVHPPSKPVPGAQPPYRDSGPVLPRRLKVTA